MTVNTKAVREARARVAELEAEREVLNVEIALAETKRKPAQAVFDRIKARLMRVQIVSNTGGNLWIAPAAILTVEPYGLRALAQSHNKGRKLADEIRDALASGGLKVSAGTGVSLTLKGLAGRIRRPDKAKIAAYHRAKKARELADHKAREAANRQHAAMQAVFDSGEKVPTDEIAKQLLETALAFLRLEAHPKAHQLRQKVADMTNWEGSSLSAAIAHLKFAESGATDQPCPCRNCAQKRQAEIIERNRRIRIEALPGPKVKATCPDHGPRLMAVETLEREWADDGKGSQWGPTVVVYCPIDLARFVHKERTVALRAPKSKKVDQPDGFVASPV